MKVIGRYSICDVLSTQIMQEKASRFSLNPHTVFLISQSHEKPLYDLSMPAIPIYIDATVSKKRKRAKSGAQKTGAQPY
jgi:hypothetical protein